MKKICCLLLIFALFLCSCGKEKTSVQENENPGCYKGIWFSYLDYENTLSGLGENDFRIKIKSIFSDIKNFGFNTVIFQVLPFSDALYTSSIYPASNMIGDKYDPLEIAVETAKETGISIEAWVNPLRACTEAEMTSVSDDMQLKKWYNDKESRLRKISFVNNRWYYNPGEEDVRRYIVSGIREICENYDISGIHIDDYFYPTSDESFDSLSYSESGAKCTLSEFRTESVNKLIKAIYSEIKSIDSSLTFGISPQGNVDNCKNKLYADVETWCKENGYCDYIMPQLYYSFRQNVLPFDKALNIWRKMCTNDSVKLHIGLAAYKIRGLYTYSTEEEKNDWETSTDMLSRQITYSRSMGVKDGFCVFSYRNLFPENDEEIISEKENLRRIMEII